MGQGHSVCSNQPISLWFSSKVPGVALRAAQISTMGVSKIVDWLMEETSSFIKIKGGCVVANAHPGELAQGHDKETKTHNSSYGPTSKGEKNDCQ